MIERITIGRPFISNAEDSFYTNIVVEPPISLGQGFIETIIGRNPSEVDVTHIATTRDVTILEARTGSPRKTLLEHGITLKHIADRICQLVVEPENAVHMSLDVAFTERAETFWSYSQQNNSSSRTYELVIDPMFQDPSTK